MTPCRFLPALIVSISVTVLAAPPDPAPPRTHHITLDDYFTLATPGTCKVSPDGELVAYTEMRWEPPAEKRNTDIWVVDPDNGSRRRLTFDPASDGNPQWSPDEKHVYFTSARTRGEETSPPYDGSLQVWRIAVDGGEPQPITRVPDGIGLYDLSADGRALYYTTSHEVVDEEWKELRGQYKALEYGHGITDYAQLWRLDLESWRTEKLVEEHRAIAAFRVSRDQRRVAMLTAPNDELITHEGHSRIDVRHAATGEIEIVTPDGWRADHPSPYGWIDDLDWSADGDALAFTISFDGYPPRLYVAEWGDQGATLRELTRPDGVTIVGGTAQWRGKSRDLCLIGEERARARVYCIEDVKKGGQGKVQTMTPGDVVISAFSFAADGSPQVVILSDPTELGDFFAVSRSGKYERLTRINPQVDTWKLPQLSIVTWQGSDGTPVEGILELPPDHQPGRPLPMVVEIHGGPTAASMYHLRYWIYGRTLLAARGYALLSPNYRGSTGYGDRFMIDLIGRENDIDVDDILRGVEAMIERGIADPDRLGVMGWSNGGFLTKCVITTTDRFKAASAGAGVVDQVIQWGTQDTPGHNINYMQGLPWSVPDAFRAGSPLYRLDRVRTPTLIHVGEHDARVPAAHARALYRGLKHYLNVPTELIVYPGEGHGLMKYEHRKAKMAWDLAWFERYLAPSPSDSGIGTTPAASGTQ